MALLLAFLAGVSLAFLAVAGVLWREQARRHESPCPLCNATGRLPKKVIDPTCAICRGDGEYEDPSGQLAIICTCVRWE